MLASTGEHALCHFYLHKGQSNGDCTTCAGIFVQESVGGDSASSCVAHGGSKEPPLANQACAHHACTRTCSRVRVHVSARVHGRARTDTHALTHAHMHACTLTCTYMLTRIYKYKHVHTCMHARTHTLEERICSAQARIPPAPQPAAPGPSLLPPRQQWLTQALPKGRWGTGAGAHRALYRRPSAAGIARGAAGPAAPPVSQRRWRGAGRGGWGRGGQQGRCPAPARPCVRPPQHAACTRAGNGDTACHAGAQMLACSTPCCKLEHCTSNTHRYMARVHTHTHTHSHTHTFAHRHWIFVTFH